MNAFDDICDCCNRDIPCRSISGLCSEFPGGVWTELGCLVCSQCCEDLNSRGVTLNPKWVKIGREDRFKALFFSSRDALLPINQHDNYK